MSSGINGPLTELQRKALAQAAENDGIVAERDHTSPPSLKNPKSLTLIGLGKRGLMRRRDNAGHWFLTNAGWTAVQKLRASERPVGPVE